MAKKNNIPRRSYSEAGKIALNKPEYITKISGKNSHLWKENYDELSVDTRHIRMRKELAKIGIFKPDICPICGKKPRIKRKMHLMNIDHKYRNDLNEWFYMCNNCHKGIYDFLAGLKINKIIKPIPNLIENLLQLKTREEREQLLKEVILNAK